MIAPPLQALAQTAAERVLNSLPEGLLIALSAWALLRILPRQDSRTRFALWFVALLAVVALPVFGGIRGGIKRGQLASIAPSHAAAIYLPSYWAAVLFIAWALAACLMTLRLIAGLWRLRELRRTCTAVDTAALDPSLRSLFVELNSTQSKFARPVILATSDHIRIPAAIGLWKPMIVLPAWVLRDFPASDLSIILRHEFAHLHNWDDWTNLVQKVVRALFFFHPAVWWIEARLSVEREMACDDVVVSQTANPAEYASCLVSLLERSLSERGWTMVQAFVHRARETSIRLARILDNKGPVATRVSKSTLGLAGGFAALCLVVLPNTPQVISFEPNSLVARNQYSATVARSTISRPEIVPAVAVGRAYESVPVAATPALFKPALKAPRTQKKRETVSTGAAAVVARAPTNRESVPADGIVEEPVIASASDSPFQANSSLGLGIEQNVQAAFPAAVVLVHTTEFVESDSHMVWRIQVWRVMFVDATWEHKARVPGFHST